jgi:hypothetical protein
MPDTPDAQAFGHFHKHGPVFDVNDFFRRHLGDVQGHFENIRIRFSEVNETGGYKKINEFVKPESTYAIVIQLSAFIAHYRDLDSVFFLDTADEP